MSAAAETVLEPDLPICDPHHHLWDSSFPNFPIPHYMLGDLLADIAASGHKVESTVFVECMAFYRAAEPTRMRYIGETEFVNGVAAMAASGRYGTVRACEGIVSRAELDEGAAVEDVLTAHIAAGNGRFRGIRHAGAWDASPAIHASHTNPPQGLYRTAKFREGFSKLAPLKLSFEAWQYHPQLPDVISLASAFPDTKIVLNHVGGPVGIGPYADKHAEIFPVWAEGVRELAKRPNVFVKLGGLGMTLYGFKFHARETPATSEDLAQAWGPYLETCIEAFGPPRAMFESNFPVDKVSCSYRALWNAFKRVAKGASADEKAMLFCNTARRFYRLDD